VTSRPRPASTVSPATPAEPPAPEAIVRAIAGLAARLSEVMIKETALVIAGRVDEIAPLASEKAELARAYAGRWGQLKANRAALADLSTHLRDLLQYQVGRLSAVAAENEKALRVMQNATDRVLGIVTRAIRQHYTAGMSYTRGKMPVRRAPGLLGVAFDRTL
jgi:hypothetical protein